ncbi:MAG: DNA polymerase III subunit delta [Rubritalea sp.]|jgi:DNA polymerase-3 subunit delta
MSATSAKSNIHLIHGTDDGAVSEAAIKLFNQLKPAEGDDFANDIIDGNADNAEHAHQICLETIQALLTLPFFGGAKVVWLKRATFMGTDRTGEAARAKEGVESLLEILEAGSGIGDDIHFIISASAIHKSRRFFKYLKTNANLIEHNKLDTSKEGWEEQVALLVEKRAATLKLNFEPDAMDLFVALAGEDTRQIKNELEKLDLYTGVDRQTVNIDDVRKIVPLSRAGVIFEIGSAIQKADANRALELIDQQLIRGESAIAILRASLIPTIRNLFMAKAVQQIFPNQQLDRFNIGKVLGSLPSSETQWLPQKKTGGVNTWSLAFALLPSRAYPMSALRHALESSLQADKNLVTTALDHRMILHRLIVELISSSKQPAKRRTA